MTKVTGLECFISCMKVLDDIMLIIMFRHERPIIGNRCSMNEGVLLTHILKKQRRHAACKVMYT